MRANVVVFTIPLWGVISMARNTGEDYRKASVKERTQVENPRGEQWTKRDETPDSEKRGELMGKKESSEPFKGVAKEKDERRKSG